MKQLLEIASGGVIEVSREADQADAVLIVNGSATEPLGLTLRPEEARRLAQALLQAAAGPVDPHGENFDHGDELDGSPHWA